MNMTYGDLVRDHLAVDSEAAALCKGLNADQIAWRPSPDAWSIAENLAHLNTTTQIYLPVIDSALARYGENGHGSPGPFRLGWYGRLVVGSMEPPPKMRLRAPGPLKVLKTGPPEEALAEFLRWRESLRQRMEKAKGLDLTAFRFSSPLSKLFRMNLLECFALSNAHSRRHMWQARNVRRQIESR